MFDILKVDRIMSFCNIFMERPSYTKFGPLLSLSTRWCIWYTWTYKLPVSL